MGKHFRPEGFLARGGDVPLVRPHDVLIVGFDVAESDELWYARCPRAAEMPDTDFVQSIRGPNKVEQPVAVFRDGERILALAGRRRIKAARLVWDEQDAARVPEEERVELRYILHAGTPEELYAINVRENNARKDLTPMQRADGWRAVSDRLGVARVAALNGVSEKTVRDALAIFECAPKVQRAFEDGKLAAALAPKFAGLPRTEQAALFDEMVAKGATKGRAAKKAIEEKKKGNEVQAPRRMRPRAVVERLREALMSNRDATCILDFVLGEDMVEHIPSLHAAAQKALGQETQS
jgi:ParB-like chromosome segregation protein Spo0J